MKALLVLREAESSWMREFFPGLSPYLLKIVNRPLIDYYLDLCLLLKVKQVRLLFDYTDRELTAYLGEGEQWGLSLDYNFIREGESFEQFSLKNSGFLDEGALLVLDGYFFPAYDRRALADYEPAATESLLYLRADEGGAEQPVEIREIQSPDQYFRLNYEVLEAEGRYFLPGYSSEAGLFIGQNVTIPRTARVEKPLSIGNDVQLKIMTALLPGAIVGDGVIIDAGTTVEESIVFDHTYIGSELELKGVIAYKDRLIEPASGVVTLISEAFLVSPIESSIFSRALERVGGFILALLTIVWQSIPFLLLYPLLRLRGTLKGHKRAIILNKSGDVGPMKMADRERRGLIAALFYRLSLGRFPYLFAVLRGRLSLVGNRILTETPENRRVLERLSDYRPGVFSYPGLLGDEQHIELHENYYNAHCSILFKLLLFVRALLKGE